jgi:Hsp20/alpha crystallin family
MNLRPPSACTLKYLCSGSNRRSSTSTTSNRRCPRWKGQSRREEKEEKGDYYRCEVSHGSFSRTVTLLADVREEGAKAELKDGMLEVTLPKTEKSKKRAIKID